jgi:integrase
MGICVKYVQALPSGRLQYRRAFPDELRPFIGQGEFIRSLRARSMDEPGAMDRYRSASAEYERLVAVARKAAEGRFDGLPPERIEWLAASYVHERLAHDDETRFDRDDSRFELETLPSFRSAPMGFMDGATRREKALAGLPIVIADLRDAYGSGDAERIIQIEGQNAEDLAAFHSLRLDVGSDAFAELCRKLLVADIELAEKLLARFRGEPVPTPPLPEAPRQSCSRTVATRRSFYELATEELKRPVYADRRSMNQAIRTALRFFREVHGAMPAEEITRSHVSRLMDLLARCPAKRKKHERKWSVPKLVESREGEEFAALTWKTRSTHLSSLKAVYNDLQLAGAIPEDRPNPFARHDLGKPPAPLEKEGFSDSETKRIFALGVFTAGERPGGCRGEAGYWMPLMLIATGARPEEIAQLLISDVRLNDNGSEWTLTITDDGVHPHKGKRRLKSSKARRTFPLPRVLLELGFLDYVRWLKEREEIALFPALRTKGELKLLYDSWGEWWRKYLRANDAYPSGAGRQGGRDFRHTWATLARRSGVTREAQEYIMGHTPTGGSMNARYGSRQPLGAEIHKVVFDGLGLENVAPWEPPSSMIQCDMKATARNREMEMAAE